MEALFAIRWYLILQLFGLAALPLALRLFRSLPGRGYAFARALGLLAGGWALWILSVLGWLPNTAGAAVAALALLVAFGIYLWLRDPESSLSIPWRHVLGVELVFAASFAAWCVVRAHMPRIQTSGGEKWMEIAFLNSVLRAPRFPPHDPWLSGFAISYYYFGYVMMGTVTRLAAVPATIGFNLGIATLFALTCSGAYGLVYGLLAARGGRETAAWGGLLGPLLVAIVGNLEGLLEVLHARGLFPASFWEWLDIRSINVPPPLLSESSWMPQRFMWWWRASRVLHDYAPWHTPANPAEWEVIDEFPGFSFLLGDMHPHVLTLPFALLALALALTLFLREEKDRGWKIWGLEMPLSGWELFVYTLCLGGLGFLNTWDFPIYWFVVVAALALLQYRRSGRFELRPLVTFGFVLAIGGFLLYLPFWLGFRSQAGGLAPNLFNGTRVVHFVVMFGTLLVPVVALVIAEVRRRRIHWTQVALWALAGVVGLVVLSLVAGFISPENRRYLTAWRTGEPIPGLEHIPNIGRLTRVRMLERILSPWTPLLLGGLLSGVAWALLKPRDPDRDEVSRRRMETAFALLLVATGVLLTLAVEFIYLRDVFGTRMNTVFKFYFQAWVMWAIAGAYSLARAFSEGRGWAAVAVVLVIVGLVYPTLAIPTRAREYGGPPTLDGAAYLYEVRSADFAAIDWLNRNVEDVSVILETPGDQYSAYVYEGRVSAFTGLPTLLGWGGHQNQWRGNYRQPARREPDIEALYTTTDLTEALALLKRYDIRYVYVGPVERARYPTEGLEKFGQILDVVYESEGVTIYRHAPSSMDETPVDAPEPTRPDGEISEP